MSVTGVFKYKILADVTKAMSWNSMGAIPYHAITVLCVSHIILYDVSRDGSVSTMKSRMGYGTASAELSDWKGHTLYFITSNFGGTMFTRRFLINIIFMLIFFFSLLAMYLLLNPQVAQR